MKRYEIQIRNVVKKDIEQIKDFIVEKNSREHAERYAAELCRLRISLSKKTAANTPSVTRLNFMRKCSH